MDNITKIFKALSDPNRVRILQMLINKTLCVCEIQDVLDLSISTVSKHLSILKEAGFLLDEKSGKWVYYRLNTQSNDLAINQLMLLLPIYLNNDKQIIDDKSKLNSNCQNDVCCK